MNDTVNDKNNASFVDKPAGFLVLLLNCLIRLNQTDYYFIVTSRKITRTPAEPKRDWGVAGEAGTCVWTRHSNQNKTTVCSTHLGEFPTGDPIHGGGRTRDSDSL